MTVAEFIAYLQTQPQDVHVVYRCCSEYCLLEKEAIRNDELCKPRPDGWIEDARPDKPTQTYLLLPGI